MRAGLSTTHKQGRPAALVPICRVEFAEAGDPAAIARRLDEEPDLSARRALLLALGEFDEAVLPGAVRTALLPKVRAIYRTAADPGLHAAAEWLLRTWKQEAWLTQVNDEWAKASRGRERPEFGGTPAPGKTPVADGPGSPRWYVGTQGQTFVVIPGPVEFLMGAPKSETGWEAQEAQHRRRIGRSFAIASKPVTLAEYRALTRAKYEVAEKWNYDPHLPAVGISWYMAARYCNLLSKAERIPEGQWCYEINGPQDFKLKANYLSLDGYRLPTEAKTEYATRAGATTSRYYGETEDLLDRYAWFSKNTNDVLKPVGRKKPNDLGFFDAHGNCFTWCQEEYGKYPTTRGDQAVEDTEGRLVVNSTRGRPLRGGSFGWQASNVRSAYRYDFVPTMRNLGYGFRPARTLLPGESTALPPPPPKDDRQIVPGSRHE